MAFGGPARSHEKPFGSRATDTQERLNQAKRVGFVAGFPFTYHVGVDSDEHSAEVRQSASEVVS